MPGVTSKRYHTALEMMSDARRILFLELHCPGSRTQELVNGVDRLSLAFEFAENPLGRVRLCPNCECFCLETLPDGSYRCFSCDHHWS